MKMPRPENGVYNTKNLMGARVFVNGNEIRRVFFADTKRGVVEFYPVPLRVKKPERDRVYSRKLFGDVTIMMPGDKVPGK